MKLTFHYYKFHVNSFSTTWRAVKFFTYLSGHVVVGKSFAMKFLFVTLSTIIGFYLGMLYGGLTLPEGSGLAGGAIVFFDGCVGAIICLIVAILGLQRMSAVLMRKLVIVETTLVLVGLVLVFIRLQNKNDEKGIKQRPKTESIRMMAYSIMPAVENKMGLGLAQPNFYNLKKLYFYGAVTAGKAVDEPEPFDSLCFSLNDSRQFTISYAPPWFAPAHLKLDYEVLYLKLITFGNEWVQVEVNEFTGRTAWAKSLDFNIKFWPQLLLAAHSVENVYPDKNWLRVKPLDNAAAFPINKGDWFLIPLLVKGEWIQVELRAENGKTGGRAWLRWKKDEKLWVKYSLFS